MIASTVGAMAGGDAEHYAQIASLAAFTVALLCTMGGLLSHFHFAWVVFSYFGAILVLLRHSKEIVQYHAQYRAVLAGILTGVVVDASVALAWCFPDEASEYADGVVVALEGGR